MRLKFVCAFFSVALAAQGFALVSAATALPTVSPAPKVIKVSPTDKYVNVPLAHSVTAIFSVAMNPATITAATFKLAGPGTAPVKGTVAYNASGQFAKFTPTAELKYNTLYTATITTGAKSKAGVKLAANYAWTFTTIKAPDFPKVTSTTPRAGALNVAADATITATFSQAMAATSISTSTFTLSAAGAAVSGKVTYSFTGSIATFTPSASLSYSTLYTATITTGTKSKTGIPLQANYKWTFKSMAAPPANTAYVDFSKTEQVIRGFGGSTAWMPALTASQADTLFGTESNELGLSILRVRIDPYTTANWVTELTNGQLASARGATVFATPWTPPANMKSNDNVNNGGSLNASSYADYATYLESYVTYFKKGGVDLYAISMQNEPEENVSYESCVWTPEQMETWVANNSSVITTKLMMPESAVFNTAYSDLALDDPKAEPHIAIIGEHLYMAGTAPGAPFYYTNAESKGKEVWETEHYLQPSGAQPGIADALAAAMEIHNSLTVGSYNAYLWWWVADWNPGGGETNYRLVDSSYSPNYYGYALAQFSKFVRPGDLRTDVTGSIAPSVYISAYQGGGHVVIVAINNQYSSVSQPFLLENHSVTSVTPYQTTGAAGIKQLGKVSVVNNYFTYSLPAQSITTFME